MYLSIVWVFFASPCEFNSFRLLSLISPDDQEKVLRQEEPRQWFIAVMGANKHLYLPMEGGMESI